MHAQDIKALAELMKAHQLWVTYSANTDNAKTGTIAVYEKQDGGQLSLLLARTVSVNAGRSRTWLNCLHEPQYPELRAIILALHEQEWMRSVDETRAFLIDALVESLHVPDRSATLGLGEFGKLVYHGELDFLYVTDDESGTLHEVSDQGVITM